MLVDRPIWLFWWYFLLFIFWVNAEFLKLSCHPNRVAELHSNSNLDLVATGPIAVGLSQIHPMLMMMWPGPGSGCIWTNITDDDRPALGRKKQQQLREELPGTMAHKAQQKVGWVTQTHTYTRARAREWIIIKSIFNKNLSISIWDLLDECALFRIARRNLQFNR